MIGSIICSEATYMDDLIAQRGAASSLTDSDRNSIQETMLKLKELAKEVLKDGSLKNSSDWFDVI